MLDLALFAKGRENYILKLGMVHPKLHVKKILKEKKKTILSWVFYQPFF